MVIDRFESVQGVPSFDPAKLDTRSDDHRRRDTIQYNLIMIIPRTPIVLGPSCYMYSEFDHRIASARPTEDPPRRVADEDVGHLTKCHINILGR